jgi:trimeric autotransporter adhesin
MLRTHRWCGIAALLSFGICSLQTLGQCTSGWLPGAPAGDIFPSSLIEWDPDGAGPKQSVLFAAGHVPVAGPLVCKNVAVWDGVEWGTLGSPPDSKYLLATTIWNGNPVISVDSEPTGVFPRRTRVFRWSGTSWLPLDGVFDGSVLAMASFRGDLIVAGDFSKVGTTTVKSIARWSGTSWQPLGAGMNNTVTRLIVFGGNLIAGGGFSAPANGIAAWNGTSWSGLAGGGGYVDEMIEYNGRLAVSGLITSPAPGVALWNGSTWQAIGFANSVGRPHPSSLGIIDGNLVANGIRDINVSPVSAVTSTWNGASWTDLTANDNEFVPMYKFASFRGIPVAVGARNQDGQYSLLLRPTSVWSPITPPAPAVPDSAMATTSLGVIDYSISGKYDQTRIQFRCWNGESWRTMGRDMLGNAVTVCEFRGTVYAFVGVWNPSVGMVSAKFLRWSGEGWDAISDPEANIPAYFPSNMVVWNDRLVVTNGMMPHDSPAMWDGTRWSAMPRTGISAVYCGAVVNGELYLGGSNGSYSTVANVKKWNGALWESVGTVLGDTVFSMCAYQGRLVASGSFRKRDTTNSLQIGITMYDGTSWVPLGAGLGAVADGSFGVKSVRTYNGRLIAGGDFWTSGTATVEGIAEWDGAKWMPFGGGVHDAGISAGNVRSLAEYQGELLAKGKFRSAGQVVSEDFARFSDSMVPFIARQPMSQRLYVGESIQLDAIPATGYPVTELFWTRNGTRLLDGATPAGSLISGSASASLQIRNATTMDSGEYRLTARSSCGDGVSMPAQVQVVTCDCPADFDRSGGTPDSKDIDGFFSAWLQGDPSADTDCSGGTPDTSDIGTFFTAWLAGGC